MSETPSSSSAPFWSVSLVLMLGLVVCFAAQQIVIVRMEKPYDAYLALSGYGMKSGHLWELLTYQFFHTGLAHLLVNLAGLWFVGRQVESRLGRGRFLLLYLVSVLVGGMLQGGVAYAGFALPESQETMAAFFRDRFGGPVSGSTVGLCGVFAVFCLCPRDRTLSLPGLPRFRTAPLVWMGLGAALLLVVIPSNPSLAHLAHLGGLLTGWAAARLFFCRLT